MFFPHKVEIRWSAKVIHHFGCVSIQLWCFGRPETIISESKKVFGLNLDVESFCVEPSCFPCTCMGFLQVLPPTAQQHDCWVNYSKNLHRCECVHVWPFVLYLDVAFWWTVSLSVTAEDRHQFPCGPARISGYRQWMNGCTKWWGEKLNHSIHC